MLEMYETAFEAFDYGLGSVGDVEAHENDTNVGFHGGFFDIERFGYFAITFAGEEKLEDFELSLA